MTINVKEKLAGVLIPVFALRRDGDLGIGDTLAFEDAVDFCARNNFSILQTLPINETSGDNSPYNSISSKALEPCLLSMTPELVPGLTKEMIAAAGTESGDGDSTVIDYDLVKSLKLRLFRSAFDSFCKSGDKKSKSALEKFETENRAWLEPYVVFRTIVENFNGNTKWTDWPEELRTFSTAKAALLEEDSKGDNKSSMEFFSYVQWVGDSQWRRVKEKASKEGVRLMGDIPFGVSRYSADVWNRQELFDLDWSGGAPPEPVFHNDLFTKEWGQNWGIPLYDWSKHRAEKFEWWKTRIGRLLEHFHDFRIDHVLGFFRVYSFPWVPEDNGKFLGLTKAEAKELTDGRLPQFLPRPDEPEKNALANCKEGVEILTALSEGSGDCNIVAEDLGIIVPEYMRPALHKLGMAGFAIPIFERDEETREFKSAEELHPLSLATYATHDHEPISSYYTNLVDWWEGPEGDEGWKEVQRLMRFLGLPEEEPPRQFTEDLHLAFIQKLVETKCWAAVLMVSDLLGTEHRFNQPGMSGAGCWTRRLDMKLDQYESDSRFGPVIKSVRKIIGSSARAKKPSGVASGRGG